MGNSRCATIAAAYLMIKKDYSATQALQYMRNSRSTIAMISPNVSFVLIQRQRGAAQPWLPSATGGEGQPAEERQVKKEKLVNVDNRKPVRKEI